jgi:hypothetical protein
MTNSQGDTRLVFRQCRPFCREDKCEAYRLVSTTTASGRWHQLSIVIVALGIVPGPQRGFEEIFHFHVAPGGDHLEGVTEVRLDLEVQVPQLDFGLPQRAVASGR